MKNTVKKVSVLCVLSACVVLLLVAALYAACVNFPKAVTYKVKTEDNAVTVENSTVTDNTENSEKGYTAKLEDTSVTVKADGKTISQIYVSPYNLTPSDIKRLSEGITFDSLDELLDFAQQLES